MIDAPIFRYCLLTGMSLLIGNAAAVQPTSVIEPKAYTQTKLLEAGLVSDNQPVISIILDDLGYRLRDGTRAVNLQGKITYAILPRSPHAKSLALLAHQQGKEIMLHLPMQAESGKAMGPVGLSESMSEQKLKSLLHKELNALPNVRGFNNHMGSYLTQVTSRMRWLMEAAMFHDDLYFVDSKTTASSVAAHEAEKLGIDYTSRDIFLDYEQNTKTVRKQLEALLKRAKEKGSALAIGHPYPETVSVLETWLPTLKKRNIRLVPVSELISLAKRRSSTPWQMSSSLSRKVVKNSKQ